MYSMCLAISQESWVMHHCIFLSGKIFCGLMWGTFIIPQTETHPLCPCFWGEWLNHDSSVGLCVMTSGTERPHLSSYVTKLDKKAMFTVSTEIRMTGLCGWLSLNTGEQISHYNFTQLSETKFSKPLLFYSLPYFFLLAKLCFIVFMITCFCPLWQKVNNRQKSTVIVPTQNNTNSHLQNLKWAAVLKIWNSVVNQELHYHSKRSNPVVESN